MRVPAGMEVLLGNGSDDLIQIVTLSLAKPGAVMMYPGPTFVMYAMNATYFGMRAVQAGLRDDFSLDLNDFLEGDARAQAGAGVHRVSEQSDRRALPGRGRSRRS